MTGLEPIAGKLVTPCVTLLSKAAGGLWGLEQLRMDRALRGALAAADPNSVSAWRHPIQKTKSKLMHRKTAKAMDVSKVGMLESTRQDAASTVDDGTRAHAGAAEDRVSQKQAVIRQADPPDSASSDKRALVPELQLARQAAEERSRTLANGHDSGLRELHHWRKDLSRLLVKQASEADGDERKAFVAAIAGHRDAEHWADSVVTALELAMAQDDQLRLVVARLDWERELSVQVAVATALDDMRRSLRSVALSLAGVAAVITTVVEIV